MTARELWRRLRAWRGRRRARRQEQRRQAREQQLVLWGGPVEAGRVLAFSDAIFAIAITLLTINLEVRPGLHGAAFTSALHQLLPALGDYALSFLILGQLWLAHHRIFGVIARVDYVVLRRNLLFLGLIACFLLRPGDGSLGDLSCLADDLLRLLPRLGEDLLVADAGPRHLRLHGVGGGHALRDPPRALVEHVGDRTEGVPPEEVNEDEEGDQLDRQTPGVDTKCAHTL